MTDEDRAHKLRTEIDLLTAQVSVLTCLAVQYRDDMRHPPAEDSRRRRIQWTDAAMREPAPPVLPKDFGEKT